MTASTKPEQIKPEKILKDLQKLWSDLGKEDSRKGSAGVLRACAMTLIATVEGDADAQSVGETIANLMHQHPSRVIVMRVNPDETAGLDARVFAQCWMPFGRRQQICCEEIEITASQSRIADLPKLVLGIMAPDLPVVLWCRSEKLCRDPAFQQLFELTEKIIMDSSGFADPLGALNFIRGFISGGRNVADLAWTRLTHVRATISQIFENENTRARLKTLERVTISYAGPTQFGLETMPTCLYYLQAWFRDALSVAVDLQHTDARPNYEVSGIRLEGPAFVASVELQESMAEVTVNQLSRRVSFPKLGDCDLLREELSIVGVDPIYRRCIG